MSANDVLKLTVGILTFQRPDELTKTLAGVLAQVDEVNAADAGLSVDVLVVDNDPAGTAEAATRDIGHPALRYVIESSPGIASARNRALDEAAASDLLVYIDDDEVPRPRWLSSIVSTWRSTQAAAVMGRVESAFDGELSPWIAAGDFFARPRMPSGTEIPVAAAGNLLLDLRQIRRLGVRFDVTLGLSGGEDNLLSRRLTNRGGRIVWCDESVADDLVPAKRLTRDWLLRRSWSHGNTSSVVELRMAAGRGARLATRATCVGRGLTRVFLGSARHLLGRLTGNLSHDALGLRMLYRGGGMIAGALNIVYREYARDSEAQQ